MDLALVRWLWARHGHGGRYADRHDRSTRHMTGGHCQMTRPPSILCCVLGDANCRAGAVPTSRIRRGVRGFRLADLVHGLNRWSRRSRRHRAVLHAWISFQLWTAPSSARKELVAVGQCALLQRGWRAAATADSSPGTPGPFPAAAGDAQDRARPPSTGPGWCGIPCEISLRSADTDRDTDVLPRPCYPILARGSAR